MNLVEERTCVMKGLDTGKYKRDQGGEMHRPFIEPSNWFKVAKMKKASYCYLHQNVSKSGNYKYLMNKIILKVSGN